MWVGMFYPGRSGMGLVARLQWLGGGCLGLTVVFVWNGARREKFHFYFSRVFFIVLESFRFGGGGWAMGYHSVGFRHFPDIS